MTSQEQFYSLGDDDAVRRHIRIERENGKKLRKTPWWKAQIQKGECHFCHQQVGAENLTMDHVVPLARKGKSTRGNVVPACQACNRSKSLTTPVESILDQIRSNEGPSDE
jgi:5-methylcytosine-specific restriction enzyme A